MYVLVMHLSDNMQSTIKKIIIAIGVFCILLVFFFNQSKRTVLTGLLGCALHRKTRYLNDLNWNLHCSLHISELIFESQF